MWHLADSARSESVLQLNRLQGPMAKPAERSSEVGTSEPHAERTMQGTSRVMSFHTNKR